MITPQQVKGVAAALAAAAGAVGLVSTYEGHVDHGYKDPVGIATSCYGHTGGVVLGQHYSDRECLNLLASDLVGHATAISDCISVEVPQPSYAAFVSFSYNAGPARFCKSTMARKLNRGDLKGACAELSKWTYAGSKQLPGLVRRRAAERAECERGLS